MLPRYIGVTLPLRFGEQGNFQQSVTLVQQTRSNFKNLIKTKKGERLNKPTFGCDLWSIMFDNATEDLYQAARDAVISAVDAWLPYLEIRNFEVKQDKNNPNVLNIKCTYVFRSNQNITEQVSIAVGNSATPEVQFLTEDQEVAGGDVSNRSIVTRRRTAYRESRNG